MKCAAEYWDHLVKRNRQLLSEPRTINIRTDELKRIVTAAYNAGVLAERQTEITNTSLWEKVFGTKG